MSNSFFEHINKMYKKQTYLVLLQSSGKARGHIKSKPYDALWTLSFEPIIEILEKP